MPGLIEGMPSLIFAHCAETRANKRNDLSESGASPGSLRFVDGVGEILDF